MLEQPTASLRTLADNVVVADEGTIVHERKFEQATTAAPIEEWTNTVGWVSSIDRQVSVGVYAYHPPIAALVTSAKSLMRKIALAHGFEEHIFPRHYALEDLRSFGWLEDGELVKELMAIRPLQSDCSGVRGNDLTLGDPVQCLGFYTTLSEVQRRVGGYLPSELFDEGAFCVYEDQGGWTLRNEARRRLEQGWGTCFEFSGAEFVFAGFAKQVYLMRWSLLCSITDLLAELRITHRVVIAQSCFHSSPRQIQTPAKFRLYDVPTLDIEVYIPQYVGSRDPWLELGGGDIAGEALTSAFGLRFASGSPLLSGCQGIGWQRFALAVLSQLGTDPSTWPDPLREEYGGSLPRSRISELFEGGADAKTGG
jgi:hypothetical protein